MSLIANLIHEIKNVTFDVINHAWSCGMNVKEIVWCFLGSYEMDMIIDDDKRLVRTRVVMKVWNCNINYL